MRAVTGCEEIPSPSAKSGMKNDQFILEAYSNFVAPGKKVIFCSRDNEAVRMMRGEENVIPFIFKQPENMGEDIRAGWNGFLNLIYLLGILFGRLRLLFAGEAIAEIAGVWSGKNAEEWENDILRLKMIRPRPDEQSEMQEFEQAIKGIHMDLTVLRELEGMELSPFGAS